MSRACRGGRGRRHRSDFLLEVHWTDSSSRRRRNWTWERRDRRNVMRRSLRGIRIISTRRLWRNWEGSYHLIKSSAYKTKKDRKQYLLGRCLIGLSASTSCPESAELPPADPTLVPFSAEGFELTISSSSPRCCTFIV